VIPRLNARGRIGIRVGGCAQLWHRGIQLLRFGRERSLGADPCRCRRIARLRLGVHGNDRGVEHDRRLCEQILPFRLFAVAIREQSKDGHPNEDDGPGRPDQLLAIFLEEFPRGSHHLGYVVLFELSTMLGLHVTRSGWWLVVSGWWHYQPPTRTE
jgi:hypothetical protein